MLAGHSKMLAGLQIWHVGEDGVRSALEHALMAEPDGVVLHCYGWATSDEISALLSSGLRNMALSDQKENCLN